MFQPIYLNAADHAEVSEAVRLAETGTSGEILTVLADRSDGYSDVALVWAVIAGFLALVLMAVFAEPLLGGLANITGIDRQWSQDAAPWWSPARLFWLAALGFAIAFLAALLAQLVPQLRFLLIPGLIRTARVHDRALAVFKVGAERRTSGRTGVLIYLSMREHRAEIVADQAIAAIVSEDGWAEAMAAMLAELKQGRPADAMIAGVRQIAPILAEHFPRGAEDENEVPDRLIEL